MYIFTSYAYHKWIFILIISFLCEHYEKIYEIFFLTSVSLRDWTTTDVENFLSLRSSHRLLFPEHKLRAKRERNNEEPIRSGFPSRSFIKIWCRVYCNENEHREHVGGMWNFSSYLLLMAFFNKRKFWW